MTDRKPNHRWQRGERPRKKLRACRRCGRPLAHDDERTAGKCESCDHAEFSEALRDLTEDFE